MSSKLNRIDALKTQFHMQIASISGGIPSPMKLQFEHVRQICPVLINYVKMSDNIMFSKSV